MIARLLLLAACVCVPLFADAEQDVSDAVSVLAAALSDNNPQRFLGALDRGMPAYHQIEQDLTGLAAATEISCSIEVIATKGTATTQDADLDWYMVLRSQQDENLIERRRTKVHVKLEKRGKKWVVTAFEPPSLFSPLTAR